MKPIVDPITYPRAAVCPSCRVKLEAITSFTGNTPRDDGSCLTVCGECSAYLVLEPGGYRLLTAPELRKLPVEIRGQLSNFRAALGMVRRRGQA